MTAPTPPAIAALPAPRTRHRIDVAGAVMVLLAAGALIFGLLQGGVAGAWLSPPSIAVFAPATHGVYLGLALAAVGTLVVVLVIVPRRFATTAGAAASVGPGGPGQSGQAGRAPASAPVSSRREESE